MTSWVFSDNSLRLTWIGADDHGGYIWIATILSLVYSTLATTVRLGIKFQMYGGDDYLLFFAMLTHTGQAAAVFYGLKHGMAKANSVTDSNGWSVTGKAFLLSETLTVLVVCLAKCSTVSLILRVFTADTERGKRWVTCWVFLGLSVAWGIGSILGLAISCDINTILTVDNVNQCKNQFIRWQIIAAFDIILDVLTCFLPLALIWSLNMPWKLKFQVVVAFLFRLPLVVLSGLHANQFQAHPVSSEPQLAVTTNVVLQQIIITWAIVSATIPNLKSFMKAFHTGLGNIQFIDSSPGESNTYALRTIGGSNSRGTTRFSRHAMVPGAATSSFTGGEEPQHPPKLRPDECLHEATVVHSDNGMADDGESLTRAGSQELIIRKEVHWTVEHEVY